MLRYTLVHRSTCSGYRELPRYLSVCLCQSRLPLWRRKETVGPQLRPSRQIISAVMDIRTLQTHLDNDIILHESNGEVVHVDDPTFPEEKGKVPIRWDKLLREKPTFCSNGVESDRESDERRVNTYRGSVKSRVMAQMY